MPSISFFSKIKARTNTQAFKTMLWFVLLLTVVVLFDLFNTSVFEEKSLATLWNPIGLIFGPALYFGVCILKGKKHFNFLKHFGPFLIMSFMYVVVGTTSNLHKMIAADHIVSYHYIYLLIPLSLWYYSFRAIKSLFRIKNEQYNQEVELLIVMSTINIINGLLYLIIFISWGVFSIEMGVDYRLLSYSISFISCLFILRFLYFSNKTEVIVEVEMENRSYSNSTLKVAIAENYQQLIINCFENTQIYLRPDISLDALAKELGIPKHHLSQVLNVYLKKSFYNFIADYRIKYAINKIELNRGTLTLESLSYECGFNSKSSFNHYFKKTTGLTPTEYQSCNFKV